MAYKSQFTDQEAGSGIFPAQKEIRARVESMARFYGMLGGVTYAEPFVQKKSAGGRRDGHSGEVDLTAPASIACGIPLPPPPVY